ncbi:MAG: ribonuclease H-like domain-containing protein, partial [Lachnospiraceae bacterium]|nr:ribonuclease H-like domain-containing protein [Lachnospiraceae bacterium]
RVPGYAPSPAARRQVALASEKMLRILSECRDMPPRLRLGGRSHSHLRKCFAFWASAAQGREWNFEEGNEMIHEIQELSCEERELIESRSMGMLLAEYLAKSAKNESVWDGLSAKDDLSARDDLSVMGESMMNDLTKSESSTGCSSTAKESDRPAYSLRDCLFFDIETTGLSASTAFIFLIGCISFDNDKWILHQFCIRMVQEEKLLLEAFLEMSRKKRILIHFNGNTFDIPFLKKRAAANQLPADLSHLISVDLYQWFRPLKKKLGLMHMNQSYLEKQARWVRTDQMDGAEVVSLFWDYTVSKSTESERLLLGHNHDDLIGMLRISLLEGYLILFEGKIQPEVIGEEAEDHSALLLRFTVILPLPSSPDGLTLYASYCCQTMAQTAPPVSLPDKNSGSTDSTDSSGQICLRLDGSQGELRVPFYHGTLRHYFPDYKNYYYLPLENLVMHKSVAVYVAKEYRIPARPENCFAATEGTFLPLPHNCPQLSSFGPMMRDSYGSKDHYFAYKKELLTQRENLATYAKALLSGIF